MEYSGPERRQEKLDFSAMLARIDERTASMQETMKTLASKERVDAVESKACEAQSAIRDHISNHQSMGINRNLIAGSYATAGVGLLAAIIAIFKH
jgi:hypothetical protein